MRIAVTGANGQIGRRVVDLLAASKEHEVIAVSRRSPPDLSPCAVSARADYADLDALRIAFAGADTLVFVSSDGVAVDVLHHHSNILRAAGDAGVEHIVAMSGLDADVTSPFCYAVTYGHTEQLLQASGCAVSLVRTSIFTEFFLQAFVGVARQRGEIRLPAENGRVSMVSRSDVSRCLATLAVSWPTTQVHELTGPEALNMHDVAAQAAEAWRTPINYIDITRADFQRELAANALDPWWCYAFSSMFASIRQHRWEGVTDEVLEITGRPPVTLGELLDT